jgi:ketosteroid isomerase-like protein
MSSEPSTAILNSYKKFVEEKNIDGFVSLFSDNVEIFDMWSVWSYQGLSDWKGMAADWLGSLGEESLIVDFEDIHSKTTAQMVCVTCITRFTAYSASGTRLRSLQNRMTFVLEPLRENWKITHHHSSAPINHETLKVLLQKN